MKKKTLALLAAIISLTSITAFAYPERTVKVKLLEGAAYATYIGAGYSTQQLGDLPLNQEKTYTFESNTFTVYPAEGYVISECIQPDGTTKAIGGSGTANFLQWKAWSDTEEIFQDGVYTIKTTAVADLPKKQFTINVDKGFADVKAVLNGTKAQLTLAEGANTCEFTDVVDTKITISSIAGSTYPSVKIGDTDKGMASSYTLDLAEGAVIDITTAWPDETYTYNVVYTDEAGYWTAIKVDDVAADFSNGTFTAKAGQKVVLYNDDYDDWKVELITYPDGSTKNYHYSSSNFIATKSGDITVNAHKYKTYTATFNVTGAEWARVIRGEWSDDPAVAVTEGANTITFKENDNNFLLGAKSGAFVTEINFKTSADADTTVPTAGSNNLYAVTGLLDGAVVNLTCSDKVPAIAVTINCEHPDLVNIWTYYDSWEPDDCVLLEQTLTPGTNTVELPAGTSKLYFTLTADAEYEAITVKADAEAEAVEAIFDDWDYFYTLKPIADGCIVDINVKEKEFDSKAVIYVDKVPDDGLAISTPFCWDTPTRKKALNQGYNIFGFNAAENNGDDDVTGFLISSGDKIVLYHNGEAVTTDSEKRHRMTLTDGDVIKVFTATEAPASYFVEIQFVCDANDPCDDIKVEKVVTDLFTTLDEPGKRFKAFDGTHVCFTISAPEEIKWTATHNDEPLSIAEDGSCTTYVNANDAYIEVHYTGLSAIDNIAIDTLGDAVYFDLNGRKVARENIAAGIYVRFINGTAQKVIVK